VNARWDEEGTLHFLGRRDTLVKTRGYRVDTGEVEASLATHPCVLEVAVVPVPHAGYTNLLHGFVVLCPGSSLTAREIQTWCQSRISAYMVPSRIEFREELPQTSTGKIPRRLLAAGEERSGQRGGEAGGFRHVAVTAMIPVGHIAYAACWLGAAQGVLEAGLGQLRRKQSLQSDLASMRLGRAQMQMDAVQTLVTSLVREYDALLSREGTASPALSLTAFQMRLNGLKVLASEWLYDAVHQLIELHGIRTGYLKGGHPPGAGLPGPPLGLPNGLQRSVPGDQR
jgi:hypothetical protein